MASRSLKLTIVISSAGGLALAVAALPVLAFAQPRLITIELMILGLIAGTTLFNGYVLWLQVRWLCLGGEQPGTGNIWVISAVACVAMGFSMGTTYAVFSVGHFTVFYILAANMAFTAGILAGVSSAGMFWVLGRPQFCAAQAP